jgi:hypothetical protein
MRAWIREHLPTLIITGLALPLVVSLVTWGVNKWWERNHSPHGPQVRVVNWYPSNQSGSQPAAVHVRVHNDGDSSAEGCVIHWSELDSSGAPSKELAASGGFGMGPAEWYVRESDPAVIVRQSHPAKGR